MANRINKEPNARKLAKAIARALTDDQRELLVLLWNKKVDFDTRKAGGYVVYSFSAGLSAKKWLPNAKTGFASGGPAVVDAMAGLGLAKWGYHNMDVKWTAFGLLVAEYL